MSILTTQNLSKAFGADEIFASINVSTPHGAKIAIVGPNGAGKTTLLRLLIGLDSPTEGMVYLAKNIRWGYLPQNPDLSGEQSVYEEMLTAFAVLRQQEEELNELALHLNEGDAELLDRYGKLQASFELAGGYTYELEIERVLGGLGFPAELHDRPLNLLSGGQKTRALLARLLLEKPDLLVLDEPTNHLDITAIEWLETYLRTFEGAVLMVSHDRYFMDNVVTVIWELDWGTVETYNGNFSAYVRQREERHERRLADFEAQKAFIAKEEDFIRRNIAGQNTAQAKGRRRRLERLIKEGGVKHKPPKRRSLVLQLQASSRTGNEVLRTRNLAVGYEQPLFQVPDLLLLRGEVAAVIGANGAGKSTFLKTILGQLNPLQGESTWGAQVQIGYFAQAHEDLNVENTLLEEILAIKNLPISEARNYLASYLFTGDDVFRKIHTLSGGERGRLALAKLALAGANVLLLDEPTNHLDIASQEILQDVLVDFQGTILIVSHDRYLIDALASQIWHIQAGKLVLFKGSYAAYLEERRKTEAGVQPAKVDPPKNGSNGTAPKAKPKHGLNPYQLEKRVKALENKIQQLEVDHARILAELEAASAAGHVAQVANLAEQYAQKEAELDSALMEWTDLTD